MVLGAHVVLCMKDPDFFENNIFALKMGKADQA